jgi:hypothetical protein
VAKNAVAQYAHTVLWCCTRAGFNVPVRLSSAMQGCVQSAGHSVPTQSRCAAVGEGARHRALRKRVLRCAVVGEGARHRAPRAAQHLRRDAGGALHARAAHGTPQSAHLSVGVPAHRATAAHPAEAPLGGMQGSSDALNDAERALWLQ